MPQDLADVIAAHPLMQASTAAAPPDPSAPAAVAVFVPQPPEPLPDSSFADPQNVRRAFQLAYPVLFPVGPGAQRFEVVYLRKLTVAQIRAVQANYARAKQADPAAEPDFQIVVDAQGVPLPRGFLDLLEADDADTLDEAILDFLPRRFRPQADNPSNG